MQTLKLLNIKSSTENHKIVRRDLWNAGLPTPNLLSLSSNTILQNNLVQCTRVPKYKYT